MVMVCKALSPPASNNTEATAPSKTAQNTRCQTGGSGSPPEGMMWKTRLPRRH